MVTSVLGDSVTPGVHLSLFPALHANNLVNHLDKPNVTLIFGGSWPLTLVSLCMTKSRRAFEHSCSVSVMLFWRLFPRHVVM